MNKFALMLVLLVSVFLLSGCVKTANEVTNNITKVTNVTNITNATENLPPAKAPVRMCETDADCYNKTFAVNKCVAVGNETFCELSGYIACHSNEDCKAPAGNYALCAFPGTVNATCYIIQEGIQPSQKMNCKKDSECNDYNASTKDICAIVNASYSFCSHIKQ